MSLRGADGFRRLMTRFRSPHEMETMRERFVAGATGEHAPSSHPLRPALAHAVFDLVALFV